MRRRRNDGKWWIEEKRIRNYGQTIPVVSRCLHSQISGPSLALRGVFNGTLSRRHTAWNFNAPVTKYHHSKSIFFIHNHIVYFACCRITKRRLFIYTLYLYTSYVWVSNLCILHASWPFSPVLHHLSQFLLLGLFLEQIVFKCSQIEN